MQVLRRCKWLLSFAAKELAETDGPLAAVDANALGWAMACCSSRAFRIRGVDKPAALLPLIGTLPHALQHGAVQ